MRLPAKFLLVAACVASTTLVAHAKPRVSLELLTKPGLPLTASQQWYKVLTDLGVGNLQIRSAGPRAEMGITEQGSKASREYKVIGILAADSVLYLPGGKFSLTETARLRKWLENVTAEGAEGVTQERAGFGLSPRAFQQVQDDLKKTVTFSTKDMPAAKAVGQVAEQLKYPLVLADADRRELAAVKLADDLQGLSSGTALAAMLRPAGLVLTPDRPQASELQYKVGRAQADRQGWPIGWQPPAKSNEVWPQLFDFLNVEIQDIPVSEALEAIEGRLKVPFVYDRNAMALHGVDPSKVQADVPSKRMTYSLILKKVLFQARLKFELRLDDAQKPFLWITTVKPVK
jgi:hypothetical protein